MSRLEHDVAGHKREQYDLQAKLSQEAARLEAAQQLNQELQVQLEYAQEQLSLGQRALEQNRSQNIIMDELRHRLASHDELLREKDAQVCTAGLNMLPGLRACGMHMTKSTGVRMGR